MDSPLKLKPSTQVHDAMYDPQAERLTLTLNGAKVAALNVPTDKAMAFQQAPSHGKFFHQHIKGQHEIVRIS